MTEIPGISRPKTEFEIAQEQLTEARTAVLIFADQLGAAKKYNIQVQRIESALRAASVSMHLSASRVEMHARLNALAIAEADLDA